MGLTLTVGPAARNDEIVAVNRQSKIADYDVIILGGGCAGLSLAMRLAKLQSQCPRTLIIEQRTAYTNDRTWCFWGDIPEPVRHLVGHSWQTIRLRNGARSISVDCRAAPYRMISGESFYQAALLAIAHNPRIEILLGSKPLAEPVRFRNRWQVAAKQVAGRESRYQSAVIVDTRPDQRILPADSMLWQSFSGHEIECDADLFDPSSADLMNFTDPSDRAVCFNYVLPLARNRALVEATFFGPLPPDAKQLSANLAAATDRLMNGAKFTVLRSENGVLPMGLRPLHRQPDSTYARAGLTAGAARPSTGYAFQRIQRWADACCLSLSQGALPLRHSPDPLLLQSLDSLFISVLRSHPELASSLFLDLFEKTPTANMIRFLSDCGTWRDYFQVAAALPVWPFVREIPRALSNSFSQWKKGGSSYQGGRTSA